jgi:hypothetical protein
VIFSFHKLLVRRNRARRTTFKQQRRIVAARRYRCDTDRPSTRHAVLMGMARSGAVLHRMGRPVCGIGSGARIYPQPSQE